MGPGREFDAIRMLMDRWGDLAVDLGDDAAVLTLEGTERVQVVSTDACVDGVHFRREWIGSADIGARAAAAALSDLAAMGARADAVLLAFIVPDDWRAELGSIADGIGEVVRASGARIVGGNLSRGATFAITTTVIGSTTKPIPRSGAIAGDVLVVTGVLGGPGAATNAWYAGGTPSAWARTRFARPVPRLAEGIALAEAGARAMMDISDGLVADARHLASASGVHVSIDALRVPRGPDVDVRTALSSGEEYELLAAFPPAVAARLVTEWPARFAVPLTIVGHLATAESASDVDILNAPAGLKISGNHSGRVEFDAGHDHFSR
jgi:thiamine-monophosphate kinase